MREPFSGLSHLFGVVLSAIGLIWLLSLVQGDWSKVITVSIYGLSTMCMFAASAALHLLKGSPQTLLRLRKLDHASIYLVIAGTYTPIGYHLLSGPSRWMLLGIIWLMAMLGIIYKLRRLDWHGQSYLSTLYYLLMGWFAIVAAPFWLPRVTPQVAALIVGGGIVYTIGAVVFMLERPNLHRHFGFHELWHCFVLGGSALHFFAMALFLI